MAIYTSVNNGLGHGLLADGAKPLTEPMLAYHQFIENAHGILYNLV